MSYKNLQHYRHTVHLYLDAIWLASSHKRKARSTMYKLLSNRMNLDASVTHISMFNRAQCKEAIKILRPMYIQLYGKDLDYKKGTKMYYSSKTFNTSVSVRFDGKNTSKIKTFDLVIIVYCKSKSLNDNNCIIDLPLMEKGLREFLDNKCLNDVLGCQPTLEVLANYIYEQIIPCYKVEVKNTNGEAVIFEEDEV